MAKKKVHQHAEAYMLMHYQCQNCRHMEIIWNARDGVTPFGCPCPKCDHGDMFHVDWSQDLYAPEYCPLPGQGMWIDMPQELVPVVVRMALHVFEEAGEEPPRGLAQALANQYQPGSPWLLRWPNY